MKNETLSMSMFFITWPRSLYVQGSTPLTFHEYSWVSGPRMPASFSFTSASKPFSLEIWIFLLVSIHAMIAFICVCYCLCPKERYGSLTNKIFAICGFVIEEPVIVELRSQVLRVVFGIWLLVALVISKSYRGSLLAKLVSVELESEINTAEVFHVSLILSFHLRFHSLLYAFRMF
jgi:hypothetical protein